MSCERRQCSVEQELITCIVLTLPVVPRDRWFICCVIGPIMLAGCMDIVWSMVGVITAPWWRRWGGREWPRRDDPYDRSSEESPKYQWKPEDRCCASRKPCATTRSPFTTLRRSMWDSGEQTCNSTYKCVDSV